MRASNRAKRRLLVGDAREQLKTLPERSVQCCITSPPYFGLRDYGTGEWEGGDLGCGHVALAKGGGRTRSTLGPKGDGTVPHNHDGYSGDGQFRDVCGKCGARRVDKQLGLESTPVEYVQALVDVFREVRRVLRDDGTVWLVLGNSYNADGRKGRKHMGEGKNNGYSAWVNKTMEGTKPKDLLGIPWMVAFALRDDGWWLRADIIWSKPNAMPESVTDRTTCAHEYVFLLSKRANYWYDAEAIKEPDLGTDHTRNVLSDEPSLEPSGGIAGPHTGLRTAEGRNGRGRNKRSVWTVASKPYPNAHFAVFPPKLVEPMVLAGSAPKTCGVCGAPWERVVEERVSGTRHESPKDAAAFEVRPDAGSLSTSRLHSQYFNVERLTTGWQPTCAHDGDTGQSIVLDPFCGTATTGEVAIANGRGFIGIELNPEYAELARRRLQGVTAPLFA